MHVLKIFKITITTCWCVTQFHQSNNWGGGVDSRSVVCACAYSVFWLVHAASKHKFIKFRGCLEAASERTNVPLSSARTWTPFHHPDGWGPYGFLFWCWILGLLVVISSAFRFHLRLNQTLVNKVVSIGSIECFSRLFHSTGVYSDFTSSF